MSKKILTLLVVGVALFFAASTIQAGTEAQDTFKMKTKEYKAHKKGLVEFTHKQHAEEFSDSCGECHHDAKGKPLDHLKMGDDVQRCIECHKETVKVKGEKLKKKDKIMKYHVEAMHANCKDCHKAFNKKKGFKKKDPKAAPTSCKGCHPKTKK